MRLAALLLTFTLFSSIPGSIVAQNAQQPQIGFSEEYWYFGYIPKDAVVRHTYWIKNVGGDTLRIAKVSPGCGCTSAPLSSDWIPAGDSARMDVIFDSHNIRGRVVKDINVLSNAPDKPYATVKFFAICHRSPDEVTVEPEQVEFVDAVEEKFPLAASAILRNNSDTTLVFRIIESPSDPLSAELSRKTIAPGETLELHIRFERVNRLPNRNQDSVTLEFEGEEIERLTIPIILADKAEKSG